MSDKFVLPLTGLPVPVQRAVTKLGDDLALARRRRRISTLSMAQRIQTSVATLRRMERGDPTVAVGTVAKALWVLNEINRLSGLLDTSADELGLQLMDAAVPQRIRKRAITPESGAM